MNLLQLFLSTVFLTSYYDLSLKKCHPSDEWSIHGLWGEYNAQEYPSYCRDIPFNETELNQYPELVKQMTKVWKTCFTNSNLHFWMHEWNKHGTCSGMTQIEYFNKTLQLFEQVSVPFNKNDNKRIHAMGYRVPKTNITQYCDDAKVECLIPFDLHFHLKPLPTGQ